MPELAPAQLNKTAERRCANTVDPLGLATTRNLEGDVVTDPYFATSADTLASEVDAAITLAEHDDRMAACECPSCLPPRLGDLLPDVLAEMRRREGR